MQIPRRKSDELKRRDTGPLYLTQEGLDQLKSQLARLKKLAPDFAAEAARTAAYGDRSDNAEYKHAKGALRHAQWTILSLQDQIKRAVLIEAGPNASGTIQLGSTVVLEANGKPKVFEILGPHETDPSQGRISHRSPLGAALLNHKEGEVVEIKTDKGVQRYKIIEIR